MQPAEATPTAYWAVGVGATEICMQGGIHPSYDGQTYLNLLSALKLALPDLHVPDTTADDWQAVVDLVRSKGWAYEYLVGSRATRLPARVEDFEGWPNAYGVTLRVWPTPGVLAVLNCSASSTGAAAPCCCSSGWRTSPTCTTPAAGTSITV